MKLTVLLFFLAISQMMAIETYSQSTRLSLNFKSVALKDVLDKIEEKSEFFFLYNSKLVNVDRTVSANFSNLMIDEILNKLFKETDVVYTVVDRQIVLTSKADQAGFLGISNVQQGNKISGKVTDTSGAPLPGVSVVVKGTTTGSITDVNGNYSLSNVPDNATLQFSFVGMKSQEIKIEGKKTINVELSEETIGLDEVVAVGYGTQKKVNLTGAVSTLSAESLENRPMATTAQGLQGAIPNLNINFSSGDPSASGVDYNIRGFESINGGSPYILVDGVPMSIEDINPSDIESITVLKDASASAIYGGKAAFGVILVTTKKGKGQDKITVKYTNETAFSKPIFKGYSPVDNSYDEVMYKSLMYTNDGQSPIREDIVAGVKAYYENPGSAPEYAILDNQFYYYGYTNWRDQVLRDFSPSYKHNVSVSGGTKKSNYYISFGNYTKEGLLKFGNDVYSRNNILIKLTQNIADWISLDQKVAVNMIKTDKAHDYGSHSLRVSAIMLNSPRSPVAFPENDPDFPDLGGRYFDNIVGYLDEGSRTVNREYDTWLTTGINLTPVKGLMLRGELSYNYFNAVKDDAVTTINFVNDKSLGLGNDFITGFTSPSLAYASSQYQRGYLFNTYAEYELKDLGAHYLKAMVGFNQEEKYHSSVGATGYNLITPYVPSVNASTGDHIGGSSAWHYGLMGAFYRLNYIFNDKYLFELSGRYDGTSRFPKEDRFGFFPSGSVGWRISEEGFMKNLKMVNNLKLRASYGELGNQSISYQGESLLYPYISSLGIANSSYLVLDETNTYPSFTTMPALVSSTLTWETVATLDFGVDFTLLNQRLDGSFDYYSRATRDMLMRKKYPEIIGGTPPLENGADLETNGWEFTVSWRDKINKDFSYDLRFSLWDSKTTISKFENPTGSLASDTYHEGQVIGDIWGYETYGLFQSPDEISNAPSQTAISNKWYPGDVRFVDQITVDTDGDGIPDEGDGAITPGINTLDDHGDLKIIGNNMPRYSYSFNIGLNYKKWAMDAFFQGIGKRDYYPNSNFGIWWPWHTNGTIQKTDITDSWSEDNKDAYWFRAASDADRNKTVQTRWMQDASYLRLKSLILRYSLPSQLIGKVGLNKADLFISGQNLWEYSNLIYNRDPEQNTGNNLTINTQFYGPNVISYPSQRTFSVGVNLTF